MNSVMLPTRECTNHIIGYIHVAVIIIAHLKFQIASFFQMFYFFILFFLLLRASTRHGVAVRKFCRCILLLLKCWKLIMPKMHANYSKILQLPYGNLQCSEKIQTVNFELIPYCKVV